MQAANQKGLEELPRGATASAVLCTSQGANANRFILFIYQCHRALSTTLLVNDWEGLPYRRQGRLVNWT